MAKKQLASVFAGIALVLGVMLTPLEALAAPSELAITQQPESVQIAYPEGTSLHVEVSDPSQVESYRWILNDGYTDFELSGTSATTDTLVIPSTEQDWPDLNFRCVITDKDGNTVESEPAVVSIANPEEELTVLFVGEYAVQPGETLDLAEVDAGSGTVAFDADGVTMTFDNVKMRTEERVFDAANAPGLGIFLMRRNPENRQFTVNLVGKNTIEDTYYDEEWNAAGVVFNSFFRAGEDEDPPTLVFQGSGSLELIGGTNGIYSDANVRIDAAVTTKPNGDIYNDAITARTITIGGDAALSLSCNGTALRAKGDLVVEDGAAISITSLAPHVSVGATAKNIVGVDGSITLGEAALTIEGIADPEQFLPYGSVLGNFSAIAYGGDFEASGTSIVVGITEKKGSEPYVMSCYGITSEEPGTSFVLKDGASVLVDLETPDTFVAAGITVGDMDIQDGCAVQVAATSSGETGGVEADGRLALANATLESEVRSTADLTTYGVVCAGLEVNFSKPDCYLRSTAEGGIALASDTGEHGEFEVAPEDGYEPQSITISGDATIVEPAESEINLYGAAGYGETIKAETVYDASDMTAPATKVEIASPAAPAPSSNDGTEIPLVAGALALLAVGAAGLYVLRRREDRE